ncbi:MAG: RluA family pseudouridine synthase, partial [Oscillospiraceae bacterium]|nr:RluA family pseudouridine synthase [Oscillospiraceae bacterium]
MFKVDSEYDKAKVLHYLRGRAGLSMRLIRKLKNEKNGIQLNGLHVKTIDLIKTGDTITINIPDDASSLEPLDYDIDVLYMDDDLLIVDKPALLPVHPSHNHQGNTLANAVAWHLKKEGKSSVFRAIGRLDKGTSGIVICALNSFSASKLSGKIKKEYIAIAKGVMHNRGTIDAPIIRPDPTKTYRTVGEVGESAVTKWERMYGNDELTF